MYEIAKVSYARWQKKTERLGPEYLNNEREMQRASKTTTKSRIREKENRAKITIF